MGYIWLVIIGFVAGLIARAIKPGDDKMGIIMTSVLGIAGSFLANFVGKTFGLYAEGDKAGFIAAVIGAVVLLFVYSLVKKK